MGASVAMRGNTDATGFRTGADVETRGNFLSVVTRTVTQSGVKQEALARDLGLTPGYFSKLLAAQQGALDVVDRFPVDLQRRIAREYAESHGFTVVDPSPVELVARVFDAFEQLSIAIRLAKVGQATPAKATLDSGGRR